MSFQLLLSLEINCDNFICDHFAQGPAYLSISVFFSACEAQYLSIFLGLQGLVSQYLVYKAQYLSIFVRLRSIVSHYLSRAGEAQYLSILIRVHVG